MVRSQFCSTICWLALQAGALLFSGGALAIPGQPGQTGSANAPTSVPTADVQVSADREQTGPEIGVPPDIAAPTTASRSEAHDSADQHQTRPLDGIPCLHAFFNEASERDEADQPNCTESGDAQQHLSLQFGRRLAAGRGVFGETDGIRIDYRLTGNLTLNGVAGYPVVAKDDEFNTRRQVFGLNADTGTLARAWNLNAYLIEQQHNGRIDSTSVGGALRYARPKHAMLLFLDYDAVTDSVSAFTASGAWKLPRKTTLSASFDVRNSPVHKRQQKYLQHSMSVAEDWKWILPVDRIKHFTSQRDTEVTTFGLALSHAFSRRLKLSGDVAVLDISEEHTTVDAAAATSAVSSEYFYHLKLTGRDLVLAGNNNKLDLRHNINQSTRTSSASFDTRYAINRLWNVSPRVRTDYRTDILQKSVEWVTSPAVKMEYRWKEQYGFQIEAGGKWTTRDDSAADKDRSAYFISLGYQANF